MIARFGARPYCASKQDMGVRGGEAMDMDKRRALIEKIRAFYEVDTKKPPVVEVDDFFDGNDDEYSIAPNKWGSGRPPIKRFYEALRSIRERPEVDRVLISILECPEADDSSDEEMWPQAENVHIYANAPVATVEAWVDELSHDGVREGWTYGEHPSAPKPPPGYGVFSVCWD